MSGQTDQNLELQLASLTTWDGEAPGLWRRALESAGLPAAKGLARFWRVATWRTPTKVAACAAAVLVFASVIFVSMLLESDGRVSRWVGPPSASLPLSLGGELRHSPATVRDAKQATEATEQLRAGRAFRARSDVVFGGSEAGIGHDAYKNAEASAAEQAEAPSGSLALTPQPADTSATPVQSSTRQVVRTATIELTAPDVRTVFLKAAMLVHDATGEYVQDSALTGEGATAYANLTLRVASDRLHHVLQALRELGTVTVERTEGQDVTAQVVDLEARLRNERRVETELLELMDRRKDAPLKEILELREQLSRVRGEIERLTAQRDHLGHLVSLATVLVVVRGTEAGAVSPGTPLGRYFGDACRRAWHGSLTFLADTLALFINVLVGGLIWWVLLVVIVLMIRRWRRRLRAAARHAE